MIHRWFFECWQRRVRISERWAAAASRLAAIAKAKAKIGERAQERFEREKAEYDAKMAARAAKEAKTGKKPKGREPKVPDPTPRAEDQVNLTDEESRIMKVAGGGFEQCYNAQAVVDAESMLTLQAVDALLKQGVPPGNILYATFDHPLLKLAGIDAVLEAWREREPRVDGDEYLFLDEVQFIRDWGTWVKHQVDFARTRRIAFTGSAMPLLEGDQESGVGRWHTIRLTTLSFYEYLQIKKLALPELPALKSLRELFDWSPPDFYRAAETARHYVGHFHEYLLRGGFPQTAQVENINQAQRLLREDIIDKVLKRDMTALFGVRRVLDLENTFLYLCMHDGGLLDMADLCANLEVKRPTAQNYIELLQTAHLIYRLPPYGYGKDMLRARFKIYLADAAIAPAVMLKGKSILEDAAALGVATETAVFKHLFARYYAQNVRFTYWRGRKDHEVDLVAEVGGRLIPFEVKCRAQHTGRRELRGLLELCQQKAIDRGFVVTKSLDDFGAFKELPDSAARIMRVPASLLCYWMGASELGLDAE